MACREHVISRPDCAFCNMSKAAGDASRSARAQEAHAAAASEAAYQTQLNSEAALQEAIYARQVQEQAAANTVGVNRSMWLQSADGNAWEDWAKRARAWVASNGELDQPVIRAWRDAADPLWLSESRQRAHLEALKQQKRGGKEGALIGLGVFLFALFGLGFIGLFMPENLLGKLFGQLRDLLVIGGFFSIPVLAVYFSMNKDKYSDAARPLEEQGADVAKNSEIVKSGFPNPFSASGDLPSFHDGSTVGQFTAYVQRVNRYLNLQASDFPRHHELPELIAIKPRADVGALPESVRNAYKA